MELFSFIKKYFSVTEIMFVQYFVCSNNYEINIFEFIQIYDQSWSLGFQDGFPLDFKNTMKSKLFYTGLFLCTG